MRNENYNKEPYLDFSKDLFDRLDGICAALVLHFKTPGKSYPVSELISKASTFNTLWEYRPNSPGKKNALTEFKGLYAFARVEGEEVDFSYIGISRRIKARFSQHVNPNGRKNTATWAYLMASHDFSGPDKAARETKIPEFQKSHIHPLRYTFYPIEDNMLLHLAEIYCVNKLRSNWNSFRTH